ENPKHLPRDSVAPLGRLIWVRRRADRDAFSKRDLGQLLPERLRIPLLGVDLFFELPPIAQLHELVRIPRITVLAPELASAVRIHGPLERQLIARALADKPPRRQGMVFNPALGFQ